MKAHIGVDADSGVTHSLETSTAKLHDGQVRDALRHGGETAVRRVMRKAPKGRELHPLDAQANRIIAKVGHPFRIIRRQSGHVKTRCRGLARNRARLFTPFTPGHLFPVRRRLLA